MNILKVGFKPNNRIEDTRLYKYIYLTYITKISVIIT